jgi:hypothetical protein
VERGPDHEHPAGGGRRGGVAAAAAAEQEQHDDDDQAGESGGDDDELHRDRPEVLSLYGLPGAVGVGRPQHEPAGHDEQRGGPGDPGEHAQQRVGQDAEDQAEDRTEDGGAGQPVHGGQRLHGPHPARDTRTVVRSWHPRSTSSGRDPWSRRLRRRVTRCGSRCGAPSMPSTIRSSIACPP